jgi:hypothetical protein
MADGKTTSQMQRDAQVSGGQDEAYSAQIEGRLKDLHTCMPGIIVSFDASTQTASVQPAIQRIFTERGAVNLPVCVDVPVAFPGGGDFFLTFPVKAGDECILLFSERAIDYWHVNGGTQLPAEYRLHDLSDGIAQVGLNSQAKKLAALQMDGAELRTRDRSTYIRLTPGTIFIKGNIVHEGNNTQTGNLTRTGTSTTTGAIVGQGGLAVSGGAGVSMSGNLAHSGGTLTSNSKNIGSTHTHSGVQTGAGNSGAPN